jgi:predicted Rossmann fold flavoprotein
VSPRHFDSVIIGAGAAGLMCAIEAAKRGRRVVVLDHAKVPAEKIRISGGGRCNFTHLKAHSHNYLSENPRFCLSALSRYKPHDFVALVEKHKIAYHHKTEGQLFCDHSAKDIISMLLSELRDNGGELWLNCPIITFEKTLDGFALGTPDADLRTPKVVLATGGLSIPKMGATGFSYDIAKRFGHTLIPTRAGLVPFTLGGEKLSFIEGLAGVSLNARVKHNKTQFTDGFLFTHRGLSGPSILQISNYWQPGQSLDIDLRPDLSVLETLKAKRRDHPKQQIGTTLADIVPKRLSERIIPHALGADAEAVRMADLSDKRLGKVTEFIQPWRIIPDGTEGYRTAEVTVGGIDTRDISSQTFESLLCSGLYIIGEALDVTGWLGGYNFQWAWSSGWAAGQDL